jgi:ethanolamine utilization protein EutN
MPQLWELLISWVKMLIGRVTGNIASTIKHPIYSGQKLLSVEILTPEQKPTGESVVAIDSVSAGIGDLVLITQEGRSAMMVVGQNEVPVRTVIVAIIDQIELENKTKH